MFWIVAAAVAVTLFALTWWWNGPRRPFARAGRRVHTQPELEALALLEANKTGSSGNMVGGYGSGFGIS